MRLIGYDHQMQDVNFLVTVYLLHHLLVEVQQPGNPITEGNFEVALSFILIERIVKRVLQCGQGVFAISEGII